MTGDAFTYSGGRVEPGRTETLRYSISETYLGDPIRLPVSIVNGAEPGPTVFMSAATHGDELNGIEVVREVALEWDHSSLQGTLLLLPILNVPGFLAQQRYLPIYDRDLNRSFPGSPEGTSAKRMAHTIFRNFIEPADVGIDFHTSTRGRTNMLHVRGDMENDEVARLAHAFGSPVIIDSTGAEGTLRRAATEQGISTITIEMGEAHRFQRSLIDHALEGVASVFGEFDLWPDEPVRWPGWKRVIRSGEKTWLRADSGGLVEMHVDRGAVVSAGDTIATISNPFKTERTTVEAPFTGLLVGVLENPLVYPGNPLCHLVELETPLPGPLGVH
ncbi:MAG: succinylglutamate desuccinylase/aspartoacylase family protein [Halodesulfurarchaeum sp.]